MAKRFKSFDKWQPAVEDFDVIQDDRAAEIRKRWLDMHTWGIVRSNAQPAGFSIPVSAMNDMPNPQYLLAQFPITLHLDTGTVDVGAGADSGINPALVGGAAYDFNGERIAILDDEAFSFDTSAPQGQKSSGNLSIPLTLAGISGGALTNPSIPGTYYLWIEYLEINDPTAILAEDGSIHYPIVDDGYRIRLTGVPVPPSGDGVSLFLAKVIWAGGVGTLTVVDGLVSDTSNSIDTTPALAGDPKRVYAGVKAQDVEILVDEDNKTGVYGDKLIASLAAHINAIGGATPTADNPHGTTLKNIPGGGDEPVATANQKDSLAKGLVDLNAPQNSPARLGDAGLPTISQTVLTPVGLDVTATSVGITTTTKDAWVRIADLDSASLSKAAFVNGKRLKRLYPTVRETGEYAADGSIDPADPETGDGWIGFDNFSDTPGTYRLFATAATLSTGADVLLLQKVLMPLWPSSLPALPETALLLGQVYWDGADLWRNSTKPTISDPLNNQPEDQRSLGLVGPQQISTEAKADANTGALSQHIDENLCANGNYFLNSSGVPLNVTFAGVGASATLASNPTRQDSTGDPTLVSGGPATISGLTMTLAAGSSGSLTPAWVFHNLKDVKPSKSYAISFWYKAQASFNARVRVGLFLNASVSPTSLMTASDPYDLTLRNDGLWHRTSIIVQSNSSVIPALLTGVDRFLGIQIAQGGVDTTAGDLSLTNVMVSEGEWVPGYVNARMVPSGAIIMWDAASSCPAGFEPVTALAGRAPYGVSTEITLAAQSSNQLKPLAPTMATTSNGSHTHTINGDGAYKSVDNSANLTDVASSDHVHSMVAAGAHTHTLDAAVPYYGVIFCRAL